MASSSRALLLLALTLLFAFAWDGTFADPFIPVGSNPGGSGTESQLQNKTSGFQWRSDSLLYLYLKYPNYSAPDNTTYEKAIFFPPVDMFAKLIVPNTFSRFVTNGTLGTDLVLWIEGFGNLSTPEKAYYTIDDVSYAVGSFTLLINIDNGVVQSLQWFDGCDECNCTPHGSSLSCPPHRCVTNNCAIPDYDCIKYGATTCDIKIYVGWVGSDANGRPCTSSGSLPYNFFQFAFTPTYRAAAGVDHPPTVFNLGSL